MSESVQKKGLGFRVAIAWRSRSRGDAALTLAGKENPDHRSGGAELGYRTAGSCNITYTCVSGLGFRV